MATYDDVAPVLASSNSREFSPRGAGQAPSGLSVKKKALYGCGIFTGVSVLAFAALFMTGGIVIETDEDGAPGQSAEFGATKGSSEDLPPELAFMRQQEHSGGHAENLATAGAASTTLPPELAFLRGQVEPEQQPATAAPAVEDLVVGHPKKYVRPAHHDLSQSHQAPISSANSTESSNGTAATVASTTSTTTKLPAHLVCKGGPKAICQCLFACQIFGGQASQCGVGKVELLDALVQKAMNSTATACQAMQCVTRCSRTLDCFSSKVQDDCQRLERASKLQKAAKNLRETSTCRFECEPDADEE